MGWYGGSGGGGTLSDPPYTIEGNPTSATANTTAFTIGSLTAKTVPASTDQLMLQDNAASGALKSVPWSSMPGAGGGMSIGGVVTGGTTGSVLFIGSGPVLAQDNAELFWDDTNFVLKAGKTFQQNVNGVFVNALYSVYNASGDNWFIGESGKTTVSGPFNLAMGAGALSSLTTGSYNIGIGSNALLRCTGGQSNFGIGASALAFVANSQNNVGIGTSALGSFVGGSSGDDNVAIGVNTGLGITSGSYNVILGGQSGQNWSGSANSNTIIGPAAGYNLTGGSNNTMIGGWAGPAGAMSNVIAISDGAGSLLLDYNYTTASVWTFPAEVDLATGTASVAPMKFQSGTNLTTAAVGACEFDGTAFYKTAVASARQVVDTEQVIVQSASRTFTSNTSAQAIFNATTNGAVTLAATTTYEFEMVVAASGFSSSAHTINLGFGGTAAFTSIAYYYESQTGSTLAGPNADSSGFIAVATATGIVASNTTTGLLLYVRGTMRVNTGGTVIPQLTQVTASAAAVVQANSFFRCWPIGSNTVTNVGNWS